MHGEKAKEPLNSIKSAADSLCKSLKNLNENISIKPLKKLFKLIEEKIKPFENKNTLEIGIATINWCIDYNLYQQGYTALDETIKTLLCFKLYLPIREDMPESENSYVNREDIINTILAGIHYDNAEDVKIPEIFTSEEGKEKYPEVENFIYESIRQLQQTKKFYAFTQKIKNYRNDINHFGFNRNGAAKYPSLSDNLKLLRDELVEYSQEEFPWMELEEKQN